MKLDLGSLFKTEEPSVWGTTILFIKFLIIPFKPALCKQNSYRASVQHSLPAASELTAVLGQAITNRSLVALCLLFPSSQHAALLLLYTICMSGVVWGTAGVRMFAVKVQKDLDWTYMARLEHLPNYTCMCNQDFRNTLGFKRQIKSQPGQQGILSIYQRRMLVCELYIPTLQQTTLCS